MNPNPHATPAPAQQPVGEAELDWGRVLYLTLVSRAMDDVEEQRLVPEKKVAYQFSARGHDVAQIILGSHLAHRYDAAGAYYRSRPLLLALGLSFDDALAGPMGKSGGFSDGRDIGVVCNLPSDPGPVVLPMSGDVGSQYTPSAGWAQAILYHREALGNHEYDGAIACVLGGEASVATNGFWSALTMATTLALPMVFYIEDNGYGISVPSRLQTPGANIAENLASFRNLLIRDGDGTQPGEAARLIGDCMAHTRGGRGPSLVRLTVPRLSGHSGQDTQAYKPPALLQQELADDPLPKLEAFLRAGVLDTAEIERIKAEAARDASAALEAALARPDPDPTGVRRHRFTESGADGRPELQRRGGLAPSGHQFPPSTETAKPEGPRINLLTAVRKTLEHELRTNPKVLVFGEDVGPKGGVHAATLGLQDAFGEKRVFDTSLSEEGIIGRAVGMALAGLMPVPASCRCRRSSSASTLIRPPSSSTTVARSGGAPTTAGPRRSWCGCPVGTPPSAATPGTRCVARCCGPMRRGGRWRCRRTPKTRWDSCVPPCGATSRRSSSSTARCWTGPGRGGHIRATPSWCRSAGPARCSRAISLPWSPGGPW
jgi:2-oxoisovalerate dehydrogenase E1 component